VVLVVIIAIFVTRTGQFDRDVSREGNLDLIKLKASYGACRPSLDAETDFIYKFNNAETSELKSAFKGRFANLVDACKRISGECTGVPQGDFGTLAASCSK
jgi:hypothetical protein